MKEQNKILSRRDFLRLATAAASGALLAACVPAGQQEAAPAQQQEAAAEDKTSAAPAEETVSLRVWSHQNTSFVKANEELVKKYQEANPNVEIKYENFPYGDFITTIQTSMAAKNEADVMEMFGSWVQSYAKGGTLATVPDDFGMSLAQETFYAAPLDGYVWEGKLYGMPHEYNIENGGVMVNKRMFEEAQLGYPPEWDSWEALVSDAKKMTKVEGGNMTVAGFHYVTGDGLGFLLWQGILERGGDYFAKDGIHLDFLTPQAEETVQWLADMALKDQVVDALTFNGSSNWVGDSFFQGLVAIGFIGPWIVPVARESHPDFADPWEYVVSPHYGQKMSFAADSGWGKVVSPNSQSLEKSWDFARFCTVDQANARGWNVATGTVPAQIAIAEDPTLLDELNWLGPSLKALPFGRFVGNLQDRDFVWYTVVQTRLTEALQGGATVKDTVNKMHEEANAMIDSKLKE
jgi:multiple sugar transport system substrate-binding protein